MGSGMAGVARASQWRLVMVAMAAALALGLGPFVPGAKAVELEPATEESISESSEETSVADDSAEPTDTLTTEAEDGDSGAYPDAATKQTTSDGRVSANDDTPTATSESGDGPHPVDLEAAGEYMAEMVRRQAEQPGVASAATSPIRTRAQAVKWAANQVGVTHNLDGLYPGQCVDLIMAYYNYLGVPWVYGNGSDYTWNALPAGWKRIQNSATFVPKPGDIAVFTGGPYGYGHVSIVETANLNTYAGYDSNWNALKVEKVDPHPYNWTYGGAGTYFWGVIRPAFKTTSSTFTTAPTPKVSGAAYESTKLTAKPGTWKPAAALTYQWKRDGVNISGATASTYTPVLADVGKRLTVAVKGTKTGYKTVTTTSAATAAVTVPVTVSNASKLVEAPSGLVVKRPIKHTYTVKNTSTRTVTVNKLGLKARDAAGKSVTAGTACASSVKLEAGATKTCTWTIPRNDPGNYDVAPTWQSPVGEARAASSKPFTVLPEVAGQQPTVAGTGKPGNTLTASAGAWQPGGVQLSYQWLRGGKKIPGASSASYRLTAADAGHHVAVRVTGKKSGYGSTTLASEPLLVKKLKLSMAKPTVKGTPRVGKTLKAKTGKTNVKPDAVTYTWLRDGKRIGGATSARYKLKSNDRGKRITVKVTASKKGYTKLAKVSAKTKKVAK